MTDLRKAAEMALEALENIDRWLPTIGQRGLRDYEADAIQALRQALAQPEQTVSMGEYKRLQNLVTSQGIRLMEYESQPEQEPFEYWNAVEGWVTVDREEVFDGRAKQKMMHAAMKQTSQQYRDDPEVMFAMGWYAGFHSRTTGPKRKWVGLTDQEIENLWNQHESRFDYYSFSCDIEAKLKEKNT